jgi:hypothetical protein
MREQPCGFISEGGLPVEEQDHCTAHPHAMAEASEKTKKKRRDHFFFTAKSTKHTKENKGRLRKSQKDFRSLFQQINE